MYILKRISLPSINITNPGGGITGVVNVNSPLNSNFATVTANNATIQIVLATNMRIDAIRIRTRELSSLDSVIVKAGSSYTTIQTISIDTSEWHWRPITSTTERNWQLQLVRSGTASYRIYEIQFYQFIADFTAPEDFPFNYDPTQVVLQNGSIKAVLGFEWHNLRKEMVEKLEEIFISDNTVAILPETDKPELLFKRCVWTSFFDFYFTTNIFSSGYSGAVVFEEA